MNDNESILLKIKNQRDTALKEFTASRAELENIIECFITDIKENLEFYVRNNIRREIRKNPRTIENFPENKLSGFFDELKVPVKSEIEKILAALRDFQGWYEEDTIFIDINSPAWKAIKTIELPVNKLLRKYEMNSIDMKNWMWLSVETNEIVTNRFTESKKNFLDKQKQYKYLENRYEEESRIDRVLDKLSDA